MSLPPEPPDGTISYALAIQHRLSGDVKRELGQLVADKIAGRIDFQRELAATVILARFFGVQMAEALRRLREQEGRSDPMTAAQIREAIALIRRHVEEVLNR